MKTYVSKNTDETYALADKFLKGFSPHKTAQIINLYGDLGAGKTAFVKSIAKLLGVKQRVVSPTFVIEKIYSLPKKEKFKQLIHIDAYRLKNSEELKHLHFEEIIQDSGNLIFIEWPEKIEDALPKRTKKIYFEFIDQTTRKITF